MMLQIQLFLSLIKSILLPFSRELDLTFLLIIMAAASFMSFLLFFLFKKNPSNDFFSFAKNLGLKFFLSSYNIFSKLLPCVLPLNIMFSLYCSWSLNQKFSALTHELILVKEQVSVLESQPVSTINPVLTAEPIKPVEPFFDSNFFVYALIAVVVLGVVYYFASSSGGPGPGPSSGSAPRFEQSVSTVEPSTITTALADPGAAKGLLKAVVEVPVQPWESMYDFGITYYCANHMKKYFPEYFNAEVFPEFFPTIFPD